MSTESATRERLAVRGALLRLTPPLETVAEDVLGSVSRMDLVARDPDGGVTVVLLATEGADLARLAEGIAQCAWLSPRLPDWEQLAPHLGLIANGGVRLLLACPRFDERTRLAAEALGAGRIQLVETLPRGDLDLDLRPLGAAAAAAAPAEAATPRPGTPATPRFRSALRD
ncbi:MAG: hypothetical protein ABFS41_10760 [Myxococcota bacterium]